jgi:tight adherence protein B
MDGNIFPILIALIVAMYLFGIWQVVAGLMNPEKRRMRQRLGSEGRTDEFGNATKPLAITYHTETGGLALFLLRFGFFQGVHRRLIQAYPDAKLSKFVGIWFGITFGAFLLCGAVTASIMIAIIGGGLACLIPIMVLNAKRSKRQTLLADQLPEALDFLSRILRAGHSFTTGLQMMGEELPKPLGSEFRRCYEQHGLGQPLEDGLKEMITRIESSDFAFFVTAVLIQRQTGGDLSEVLDNISGMIRQRIRLQNHVKAKTAEGRFTGYILVAFPAVMFFIAYALNPTYTGVLITTFTGRMLLVVAFVLQMLGLYAIRKITTVRV